MSRKRDKRVVAEEQKAEKEIVRVKRRPVVGQTDNQVEYIKSILKNDITICKGPAGTGKTHIAIGMAMRALDKGDVGRIIITRPAIEAGEKLGYLPGDLEAKLDPYVRPIFDELLYYSSVEEIAVLQDSNPQILEISPFAYMRGRTFKDAFIICDECQNATHKQMLMFFTRMGMGSKMVITGDINQSDLRNEDQGALKDSFDLYKDDRDIGCIELYNEDIVRHPLITRVIEKWTKANLRS